MIEYGDLLGVQFVDGGRDPKTGLDCWGLVMVVMQRFGNRVPDFKISCFDSAAAFARFGCEEKSGNWRRFAGPAPGRLVVMAIDPWRPAFVQHYGVCLDKRHFIHILEKTKVIRSKLKHSYFSNKIAGYYEWIG